MNVVRKSYKTTGILGGEKYLLTSGVGSSGILIGRGVDEGYTSPKLIFEISSSTKNLLILQRSFFSVINFIIYEHLVNIRSNFYENTSIKDGFKIFLGFTIKIKQQKIVKNGKILTAQA